MIPKEKLDRLEELLEVVSGDEPFGYIPLELIYTKSEGSSIGVLPTIIDCHGDGIINRLEATNEVYIEPDLGEYIVLCCNLVPELIQIIKELGEESEK
jgi:hypothetical protein